MIALRTVDYHTGGEPFRIVVGGAPRLRGRTVLERRRWARDHVDDMRRLLVDGRPPMASLTIWAPKLCATTTSSDV